VATSYEEVYGRFLPKITDYSFLQLTDSEINEDLEAFLKSSIIKFRHCKKLSKRDELTKKFIEHLTDEEKEILATLMCVEYLTPKILTDDLLKQSLNSKDYSIYSQANHIKEVRELRDVFQSESNQLMISYTLNNLNMDDFK
jgi:hypothetical protein